jgi:hypothetical protein
VEKIVTIPADVSGRKDSPMPSGEEHWSAQEYLNGLFKLLDRARRIIRDQKQTLKIRYGRLAYCAEDMEVLAKTWRQTMLFLEATSSAHTALRETEDPVIVEDINADGTTYWMQRLDDLEREVAESTARLRTARQAFEDMCSDLATARHKISELEIRLRGKW